MFVDTHTHFYDEWLLPDADAAVERALAAGVDRMIQADVDSHERPAMWEVARRHPDCLFQMLGLYPGSITADNWRDELDQVYALAAGTFTVPNAPAPPVSEAPAGARRRACLCDWESDDGQRHTSPGAAGVYEGAAPPVSIVAIGEIGLDYHEGLDFVKEQKEALRLQLELAARMDLPVNIHLRDAWEDLFRILEDCSHLHLRGNLHCFTSSYEIYERANRSGHHFAVGIGGVVTFKNASVAKALERIPVEDILLETDAPYLAPVPYRGKRNESAYLPLIAQRVAEIKGLTLNETAAITTHNAETLFALPKGNGGVKPSFP